MGETNIQWCARHTVDPQGTCAHGATDEGRCLDVECKRCWVKCYSANVWIGCEKVSAACRSCWAEAVAKRMGLDVWGAGADRQLTGDAVFASIRSSAVTPPKRLLTAVSRRNGAVGSIGRGAATGAPSR